VRRTDNHATGKETLMAGDCQLVVRGATVADGSGGPLFEADIAVSDGVITQIGRVGSTGQTEIDARHRLVTPGFVDIHTHYDGQAMWDSRLAPSSWHGVTTAVMGNCGVGFAPVRAADRDRLVELMEGVEDIPGTALHQGLSWQWQSFGEYLDALASRDHDIDLCAQLPHGALRVFVMGERGARLEPATEADVAEMRKLATDAMRAGAIGFSSSRTLNHKTIKGEPTPSLRATEAELTGIALGLADAGTGVIEMISDFDTPDLDTEFAMFERIVAASGRPMSLSLAQRHRSPDGWRRLLGRIAAADRAGLPMCAQIAPRPIGVLLGLQSSRNPFSNCPAYREIADQPLAQRLAVMRNPGFRQRLLAEESASKPPATAGSMGAFDWMFDWSGAPDYEPPRERSVAMIAAAQNRQAAEVAYDLMLEDEGRSFLFAPFANYARFNLDACREMMASPNTVMGLGDGGAHVGLISDASFTTYLLTHWGRDRPQGRFDLQWLVKKLTADTAAAVGLLDRGRITVGMKADLNVIDVDALALERPMMSFDLPAGGKRLLQRARGYAATIVSGVPTYIDGEPTGQLPGRLVRGAQPVPRVH
jgi:N-acyl-D-aspartate/D-glutamate deacylase